MAKTCSKCGEVKDLNHFSACKRNLGGLRYSCKKCDQAYYKDNKAIKRKQSQVYYHANKEKIASRQRAYFNANKRKFATYQVNRRIKKPLEKLKNSLRVATNRALKGRGFTKCASTKDILGCDWETLKSHLESKFTDGMNWENQGKWHIDHIIPLASAATEHDVIRLCHYTNLQPLWAIDNLKKGAKLV